MATMPDEDCCRVCRSEGTLEDPLFYPCKCSGSIRYVHQDCLLEWLSHSNKKHCELCKTPFQFTSLYDPAMPKRLPIIQVWHKLVSDVQKLINLALRWVLVSFVWLGWLPYCTRHIWRSTIKVGDQLTANSSGHLHELVNMTMPLLSNSTVINQTESATINSTVEAHPVSFLPFNLSNLTASALVNKTLIEIFEGQVITSIIIVVFVMVFLIREWIVQNNANLLNENPEFLQRRIPAPDEGRRLAMRLEAAPPVVDEANPSVSALESVFEDAADTASPTDQEHSDTVHDVAADQSPGRSSARLASDWEKLKAEASRTAQSKSKISAESIDMRNTVDQRADVDEVVEDIPDETLVSMAELKAMRREAILRATAKRLQDAEARQQLRPSPEAANFGETMRTTTEKTKDLEARLARQEGDLTAQGTWRRHARERSIERKIWEDSQEVSGLEYPDSPVPSPRADRFLKDTFQLPEVAHTSVPDFELSPLNQHNPGTIGTMAREIEIAATTRNPNRKASPTNEQGESFDMKQYDQPVTTMSDHELEILLQRIRIAPTPSARIVQANAAVDECIRVARTITPVGALDKSDPVYRETIKQVGKIAMTANKYEVEGVIDVQKALRLSDNVQSEESATIIPAATRAIVDARDHGRNVHNVQEMVPAEPINLEGDVVPEEIMDDDIDGLLDLIGVRGPIVALLQNSMLVVVMVTSFIVFGICLPYMFGKCALAVVNNPDVYLVRMPFGIGRTVLLQFAGIAKTLVRALAIVSRFNSEHSQIVNTCLTYSRSLMQQLSPLIHIFRKVQFGVTRLGSKWPSTVDAGNLSFFSTDISGINFAETIRQSEIHVSERLTTVLCGYICLTIIGVMYVKTNQRLTTGDQGRHLELAIRSFLRQAGFVMKFIVILGIELVVFPFYCGLLLDAVLSPFVPHSSLAERLAFFARFPFTSLFLHWLIGTVYMFNFALFVSMCREIVRPGLLFFIRDPNDPTFNPIKDILERSVRSQMRKIGISLIIYGGLIVVALGAVIKAVSYTGQRLLPLNLTPTKPLFEVPFDLLTFQILLPLTFRYTEPHRKIKSLWTFWFSHVSKFLRLSSFIMGKRIAAEEGYVPMSIMNIFESLFERPNPNDPSFVRSGTFRRVPATDSLPMRIGKEMIMLVNEENELLTQTDEEDETRDDPNYTIVYAPPILHVRIYCFLFLVWAFAAVLCIACSVAPLVSGRLISQRLAPDTPVHDLFAFMYGTHFMAAVLLLGVKVGDALQSLRRLSNQCKSLLHRPDEVASTMKSAAKLILRWLYLLSTLSVLIPMLLGLALETYVIIPLGLWLNPDYVPTVHLVHDWVVGLVYVKIIGRTAIMMPTSTIGQALNNTMRNDWRRGWRNPDLQVATKHLILPVTAILLLALIVPLSVAALARWTIYHAMPGETGTMVYRMSYPATLITCLVILSGHYATLLAQRWRATVRDALYLRGRQLHNFGESMPPKVASEAGIMHDASDRRLLEPLDHSVSDLLEEMVQNVEAETNDNL